MVSSVEGSNGGDDELGSMEAADPISEEEYEPDVLPVGALVVLRGVAQFFPAFFRRCFLIFYSKLTCRLYIYG